MKKYFRVSNNYIFALEKWEKVPEKFEKFSERFGQRLNVFFLNLSTHKNNQLK